MNVSFTYRAIRFPIRTEHDCRELAATAHFVQVLEDSCSKPLHVPSVFFHMLMYCDVLAGEGCLYELLKEREAYVNDA